MKKSLKVVHIPFSGRNPYQKLLAGGLNVCGIDVKGASVQHFKKISFLNFSLFSLLFEHWKPDVVHLHWQNSFLHVEGSRFKTILKSSLFIFQLWIVKTLGVKLVWTVHNLKRHEETFRDLETWFTEKLVNISDKIIVHCQKAEDEIRRRFNTIREDQISIIPHGHFIDYYPNSMSHEAARKKLNLRPFNLTFLFLGELRYYKGVLDLVDAFKLLDDEKYQLLIAGRPHDKEIHREVKIKTANSKNIITHFSYISDDELQTYINASDVMVFPYRDIFTSGAIFLALSFGKTIIAPRLGCIADTLKGSPNFLYDATIKNGLLDTMREVIDSKDSIENIGQYNFELAHQFGWQEIALKTCHVYQKSVNE